MLVQETGHVAKGLARIIAPLRGKARFEAFLSSYLQQVQELEDAAFEMYPSTELPPLHTAWLDLLGVLVGQEREGRDNETYRLWILARAQVNKSNGTAEELLSVARLLTQSAKGDLSFAEGYPAGASITRGVAYPGEEGDAVADILQLAKAAGVRFFFRWHVDADTFQFSDTDEIISDADKGFGDDTLTAVGGLLASAK